jgi:hypothetical protein
MAINRIAFTTPLFGIPKSLNKLGSICRRMAIAKHLSVAKKPRGRSRKKGTVRGRKAALGGQQEGREVDTLKRRTLRVLTEARYFPLQSHPAAQPASSPKCRLGSSDNAPVPPGQIQTHRAYPEHRRELSRIEAEILPDGIVRILQGGPIISNARSTLPIGHSLNKNGCSLNC